MTGKSLAGTLRENVPKFRFHARPWPRFDASGGVLGKAPGNTHRPDQEGFAQTFPASRHELPDTQTPEVTFHDDVVTIFRKSHIDWHYFHQKWRKT
jgi:hypothetical protein